MEHQSSWSRGFGVGQGRCSSDPDPLQRGPCLHSWPSACAALSDLGPLFGAAHPLRAQGGWGSGGVLPGACPQSQALPGLLPAEAHPACAPGRVAGPMPAVWAPCCLRPACPSPVCSSRLLWGPGSASPSGGLGPVSRTFPTRLAPTAPALPGGQRLSFQPLLLSPWLPWALLRLLFKFLTKLLLLCFNC